MKARKYFNLYCGLVAAETYGYPLTLPNLDGVEFAIVHPVKWGPTLGKGWQVIHVMSGHKITYNGAEKTRERAKASAMAVLERVGKEHGWKWVVRRAKRKTPCIVEALKALAA
jgi:hypothetical protein